MITMFYFLTTNCLNMALWMFAVITLMVISFYKWAFMYWKRKGVANLPPSIPFGNLENPFRATKGPNIVCKDHYDEFKAKGHKYVGMYLTSTPVLIPIDLDILKTILIKEFDHFSSRGFNVDAKHDPIGAHLFTLNQPQWKSTRVKLTPTFTSGKIKVMFGGVLTCGNELVSYVQELCNNGKLIDVKEVSSCFTTDVIGSCAFGLDCNSLKNPNAEFRAVGRKIVTPGPIFILRRFFLNVIPYINKIIRLPMVAKDISEFFKDAFRSVLASRENNAYRRNDFVQILYDMREKAREQGLADPLSFEEMAAQAFVFFLAGFETSSTTMTFCLHELSFNQEIQERAREEVNNVLSKHDGQITYESLAEMHYLGQVIEETLRKYPALGIIPRECTKDYLIQEDNVLIEKGTKIWISALGIQRDPEYYPDPEKFDPDRFTEENKAKRHPCSYIPFGEGPRICIGLRFGVMQAKIGVALLLKHFKFHPNKDAKYNVDLNPNISVLTSIDNILLRVENV